MSIYDVRSAVMEPKSYSLNCLDNKIEFWSSDKETVDAIMDYIERYIQSENYRMILLRRDGEAIRM